MPLLQERHEAGVGLQGPAVAFDSGEEVVAFAVAPGEGLAARVVAVVVPVVFLAARCDVVALTGAYFVVDAVVDLALVAVVLYSADWTSFSGHSCWVDDSTTSCWIVGSCKRDASLPGCVNQVAHWSDETCCAGAAGCKQLG